MREHPLLMKGPLVRATLEGRKTQTRRLLRNQPPSRYHLVRVCGPWAEFENDGPTPAKYSTKSPLGEAGDRLWVRETCAIVHPCVDPETGIVDDLRQPKGIPKDSENGWWKAWYRASYTGDDTKDDRGFDWTPAIHMPRWACRLRLPLVKVRIERVQSISEADAIAEGLRRTDFGWTDGTTGYDTVSAREAFRELWDSIYGTWGQNPWVAVYEWEEIEVSK